MEIGKPEEEKSIPEQTPWEEPLTLPDTWEPVPERTPDPAPPEKTPAPAPA